MFIVNVQSLLDREARRNTATGRCRSPSRVRGKTQVWGLVDKSLQ